jgi:DNA-binding NarL/FixJ family response regulator
VIVDDHQLFAEALAELLKPICDVIGIYPEAPAFLRTAVALKPDVVILDMAMPTMSGLEAARELHTIVPESRIIVVTMNEDPDVAAEAIELGVVGYVLKRSAPSELQRAVRNALNGRAYVTPLVSPVRRTRARRGALTARQREVLQLLASGRSMKEVGAILNLSTRTVAFHKYRLMEHLHVHSTAELIRFAVRQGIV